VSEAKFHHYVPRFYLARFADADGALWVYDKSEDRIFHSSPERIAGENRFYDIPDVSKPDDRLFFEKQFAEIESDAAPIIDSWLTQIQQGKAIRISDIERDIISLFLTRQLVRTAEAKTQIMQFNDVLNRLLPGQDFDATSYVHFRLLDDANFLNEMAVLIAGNVWIFANNFSGVGFYTSDHPVLVHSLDSNGWRLGSAALEQDVYLILPLSPQTVMYCFDPTTREGLESHDGSVSQVEFTPDKVKHENSGQIGMSRRFVFGNSPDFDFARNFCSLNPETKNPDRKRFG
jgi:hypothetical protein